MEKNIVCLPGDGIGTEVVASAVEVLKVIEEKYGHKFNIIYKDFGGIAIDNHGNSLPDDTLDACLKSDAVLLGAIGGPKWPTTAADNPERGLLAIRKNMKLGINIRPVTVFDIQLPMSPLKEEIVKGTDFTIIRELSGGLYFGQPKYRNENEAVDTMAYGRKEIEDILHFAFKLARKRRGLVTSVDKANILETSKLWRSIAEEIGAQYSDVKLEHLYVDAMAMEFMRRPAHFDVIVTENTFGDILSDEASMLAGSLGMLPSASHAINGPSLYEPSHGSAPDIAGQHIANPIATILSVAMMLDQSFDLLDEARNIENAVYKTLEQGVATKDLGGNVTTEEMTAAIISNI